MTGGSEYFCCYKKMMALFAALPPDVRNGCAFPRRRWLFSWAMPVDWIGQEKAASKTIRLCAKERA